MRVSDELRKAIRASGETHYRIWKETGIDSRTLDRFMGEEEYEIRSGTLDVLCEYLSFELCKKKKRVNRKQTSRKE